MKYGTFIQKIKAYSVIVIHRHSKPDGDAIGSQIGLKEALLLNFPNKKIYAVGDESERFMFIGRMDEIDDATYKNSLVVVLDCGERKLISDQRYKLGRYIVKIDHHLVQDNFGDLNIVDENEVSCAGLIAKIIFAAGLKLNAPAAKALFTGLVTDSGRFKYNGVGSDTFLVASKLCRYKFGLNEIYDNLYTEDLNSIRLRARLTLDFKLTSCNVAYLINTQEDIKRYNTEFSAISRGMANIMSGIKGVDVWANFTEDENGKWAAELRSNKYNVNKTAVKYGGGGHFNASGMLLEERKEIDSVLQELNLLVKGHEQE